MSLQLNAEKFKKNYVEQKASQGIDPDSMRSHVTQLYGAEPADPTDDMLLARAQVQKMCDRIKTLGMDNFVKLVEKFQLNASKEEARIANSIKETMEGIVYMIDSSEDPGKVASQFKDRSFVCKEGTLTNLQAILGEMSLSSSGIDSYFIEQKKQLVMQTATDMYRNGEFAEYPWIYRQYKNMEIHNVTSLTNAVAAEYNLLAKTKQEDKYLKNISSKSHRKLSEALDKKLKSEEVITSMLKGVAMNINFNLPTYDEETYKEEAANDFTKAVGESLNTLKLVDGKGKDIIDVSALLEMKKYMPKGYKKNVQSIIQDAITVHLHDKGVMQHPDIDFVRFKITIEQSLDVYGNNAVDKDTLDKAQEKNCLEKTMQYIIDNNLKLDEDDGVTEDPVKYAIDNKLKIDGKDAKLYALEHVIDRYLKTQNSEEKKLLEEKYKEIHKIGEEKTIELLGVNSNLGKFLDNPNSPQIMAEYKLAQGLSATEAIDFTGCELALIEKCLKTTEQSNKEKPRDYDKFSTLQKVAFAFSFALGPIAAIVYSAIKSHNADNKKELESKLNASIDDIHKDLVKVSNSKQREEASSAKSAEPYNLDQSDQWADCIRSRSSTVANVIRR